MSETAPHRDEILAAVDRILGWPEIARSPQLGRFLDYIVRRTLAGDEQAIKAYSIAVDVLGRPADFDPQADPIVRVQARRLRALLEQYYQGEGRAETVRIGLPVGRYVPEFAVGKPGEAEAGVAPPKPSAPQLPQAPRGSITLSWFTLLVITMGIAALAYSLSTLEPRQRGLTAPDGRIQRPSVTVVEFQNLTGDDRRAPMVAGLAIELVTDLALFELIEARYGGGSEAAGTSLDPAASDFVLSGIMRLSNGLVQYSAILTENMTGTVVWSHALSLADAAAGPPVLDDVSRALSLILGSPRGPLHAPVRQWLSAGNDMAGKESLYLCRVLFDLYRETMQAADAGRAEACFAALPETERQSAQALAAMANMSVDHGGGAEAAVLSADDRRRIAAASLQRAIELAPLSAFVWEQRARLFAGQGLMELARSAYGSSVQLNPANADALAGFACLLALRGDLAKAGPMAREAVEGSPSPPNWYYCGSALVALRAGDFAAAIDFAAIYAQADREVGAIVAVMAALRAGDSDVVNRYLPQVLEVPGFRASGIMPQLRRRITDDRLLGEIRVALIEAGVPSEALSGPF